MFLFLAVVKKSSSKNRKRILESFLFSRDIEWNGVYWDVWRKLEWNDVENEIDL